MIGLGEVLEETLAELRRAVRTAEPELLFQQVGRISYVGRGIARVKGLSSVRSEEILIFPGGVPGLAFDIDSREVGVAMLGDYHAFQAGDV